MIALLRGVVGAISLDNVVVSVSGIGLRLSATPATLSQLHLGQECELATSLVVREDSLTLYGFLNDDERLVFDTLLTVSGIGPRLALATLAVFNPEQLRLALQEEDLTALQRIPGVGKKSAQRLIIEIGARLGSPQQTANSPTPVISGHEDVITALVQLGWSNALSSAAVEQVCAQPQSLQTTGEILRAALQILGGKNGR